MQQKTTEENTARGGRSSSDPIQFQDSKGQVWRVSERVRVGYDRKSVRTLVFESSMAIRCVRAYPGEWRSLSPDELEYLSWQV